jgi:hypothetical protein
MAIPDILALDFDGVLCDGMCEYFDSSRRTYMRIWPADTRPDDNLLPAFRALRPVIMEGWEMPILLRAIVKGHSIAAVLQGWEKIRDAFLNEGPLQGRALVSALAHTLDEVRRECIAADPHNWLEQHVPYCSRDEMRRLVAEPERTALVTTKGGVFARQILDHWDVHLAAIQGKEAGSHKCDNLRGLIADYAEGYGRQPQLWFVEDRLETLQHVTTHADLAEVGLFLADWGYNTAAARAAVRGGGRIHLLALERFKQGLATWL